MSGAPNGPGTLDVLHEAAGRSGLNASRAELIRDGSNALFVLPDVDIVARVGRPGFAEVAARELRVARWLTGQGFHVNTPATGEPPLLIGDRPVTWWRRIGVHRQATTAELATVLRRLHQLPVPDGLGLPVFAPFNGLEERVAGASGIPAPDRAWLQDQIARLRLELADGAPDGKTAVVHGDAWQGNVVVTDDEEPILLDFEHTSVGNPDWDLISVAVDRADFARLTAAEYEAFVAAYGGHDVTGTPWFRAMADIQELHWTTFVADKANYDPSAAREARHRIACLRGLVPKPWTWTAF